MLKSWEINRVTDHIAGCEDDTKDGNTKNKNIWL